MSTAPVSVFLVSVVLAVLVLPVLLLGMPMVALENTVRQVVRVLDRSIRNRYSFLLEKITRFWGGQA